MPLFFQQRLKPKIVKLGQNITKDASTCMTCLDPEATSFVRFYKCNHEICILCIYNFIKITPKFHQELRCPYCRTNLLK